MNTTQKLNTLMLMTLMGVGCTQSAAPTLVAGKDRCESSEDCLDGLSCVDGRCVTPGSTSSDAGQPPSEEVRYLVVMEASDSLDLTDPTMERFRALRALLAQHQNNNLARFRLVMVHEHYRTWPVEPRFLPASELNLSPLDNPASTLRELRQEPDLQNGLDGITELLQQDTATNGAPAAYRVLLFMDGSWGWVCCRCEDETDGAGGAGPLECFNETPTFADTGVGYISGARACDDQYEFLLCNVTAGTPIAGGPFGDMAASRIRQGNYSRLVQLEYRVNSLWHAAALAGANFQLDVVLLNNADAPFQATAAYNPATMDVKRANLVALAAAGGGLLHEFATPTSLDFAGVLGATPSHLVPPAQQDPFPGCEAAPCPGAARCNAETHQCESTCGAADAPFSCDVNQVCDLETQQCVPSCDATPDQCSAGRSCLAGTGQCLTQCWDGLCMPLGKMCAKDYVVACVTPMEATGCGLVTELGVSPGDPRGPMLRVASIDAPSQDDEVYCQPGERAIRVQVQYTDPNGDMRSVNSLCATINDLPGLVVYSDGSAAGLAGSAGCQFSVEVQTPSTGENGVVDTLVCVSVATPPSQLVVQIRDMAGDRSNPVCITPPENSY